MATASRLLSDAFLANHPTDAAAVLERFEPDEVAELLAATEPARAADVLERMVPTFAAEVLARMETNAAAAIIEQLDLYIAAALLRALETDDRDRIFAEVDDELADPLRTLISYPVGTAGSVMDPRIKVVAADMTVADVLGRLRTLPGRLLYYIYVVDREQKLVGVLNMRELVAAPLDETVGSVARRYVARVPPTATRETIIAHPRWRDVHALPVADGEGRLLGAIRYGTYRRLEAEAAVERRHRHPAAVLASTFELYWKAVVSVLPALVEVFAAIVGALVSRQPRKAS